MHGCWPREEYCTQYGMLRWIGYRGRTIRCPHCRRPGARAVRPPAPSRFLRVACSSFRRMEPTGPPPHSPSHATSVSGLALFAGGYNHSGIGISAVDIVSLEEISSVDNTVLQAIDLQENVNCLGAGVGHFWTFARTRAPHSPPTVDGPKSPFGASSMSGFEASKRANAEALGYLRPLVACSERHTIYCVSASLQWPTAPVPPTVHYETTQRVTSTLGIKLCGKNMGKPTNDWRGAGG